jgi:hypothetical protein
MPRIWLARCFVEQKSPTALRCHRRCGGGCACSLASAGSHRLQRIGECSARLVLGTRRRIAAGWRLCAGDAADRRRWTRSEPRLFAGGSASPEAGCRGRRPARLRPRRCDRDRRRDIGARAAQRPLRPTAACVESVQALDRRRAVSAQHEKRGVVRQPLFRASLGVRGARPGPPFVDMECAMNLHCLRQRSCASSAPPTHAAVQPPCKPSPPELRRRSALGAGKAEGKIEGDGTATRLEPGLHEGSRGTRRECPRAAPRWNAASAQGLPRAAFDPVCPAAMELRHDQT